MVRGEVTSQSRVSFWVDEMYTSDNEKLKFKTLILDFLNKTEDADSWQECHDWLKAMMLLHKIDESEFSKHAHEIPDKITKAINAIGESDEEEPKKRHPLDVLDEKARKIYWIRSMNLNPEMEKLADTKLRELEKEIMEKHRKDIPSFIEDRFQHSFENPPA